MEATSAGPGVGELLTGDLGLVVVRALLENGVGYVVSSWLDRPTPIDAAIADARERVLGPRGVVLRRLRSLTALEPIVTAPSGGVTGTPPRGAVVFAGRRGLRPALEQFLAIRSSGSVVGFCFDDDALRIEDAIVIDPEPTALGLVRAIDEAFLASLQAGRPALIVLRERALGMRGTIRQRADRSPSDAAEADAAHRAATPLVDVATAVERAGLAVASLGPAGGGAHRPLLLVVGPLGQAVERALAQVTARLAAAGAATAIVDEVSLAVSRGVGVLPAASSPIGTLLRAASDVCIVAARAERLVDRLSGTCSGSLEARVVDPGSTRGEQLVVLLADWLLARADDRSAAVRSELQRIVAEASSIGGGLPGRGVARRVPRRSEVLHRAVSANVAAGLTLAQGVIGVPSRVDAEHPTYRADTGVPLTIVPAGVFAAHGIASAAPGTGAGVFVVTGAAEGVAEAAAAAGAGVEYVDGSSPRAIGAAIGRACRAPRAASHVIVVADVQRVAAPRAATFGMDPDLVGTERLATAAVPTSATALVELGDELLAGPTVIALDLPEAHAALDPLRELSPATWDLHRRPASHGMVAKLGWNLRRRVVRAATGVDL